MRQSAKLSLGLLSASLIILLLSYLLYQIKEGTAIYGDTYNGWLDPVMTRGLSILMNYEFLKPHPLSVPSFVLGFWLLIISLAWVLSSLEIKLKLSLGILIGKTKNIEEIVSAKKFVSNVFISLMIVSFVLGLIATYVTGIQGVWVATPLPLENGPELYPVPTDIIFTSGIAYGVLGLLLRLTSKKTFLGSILLAWWVGQFSLIIPVIITWLGAFIGNPSWLQWLMFPFDPLSFIGTFGSWGANLLLPILALIYLLRLDFLQLKFRKKDGN